MGGRYSAAWVAFFTAVFLHTSTSLRGTTATFATFVHHFHLDAPVPAHTTVRAWVLRLGCYALLRPLPRHSPWLWIVDHTLQLGEQKLLVIVGCPLSDVPFGQRCLTLADLHLVALVPMTVSNQHSVAVELEKAVARTGAPRLIVSDQAADLTGGIAQFQRHHADTAAVGDIAHHAANVLENRWLRNPRWSEFLRQLSQTNQHIRQTSDAFLLSPTVRNKARFMNVGPVLRFGQRVLGLLDGAQANTRAQARYGWLAEYAADLSGWLEEYALVATTIEQVRRDGIGAETLASLETAWGPSSGRPGTEMVRGHLRVYVRKALRQARPGERLAGSSEILESAFGKLKAKSGDSCQGEVTGLALSLGAMLGPADETSVKQALDAVPQKKAESLIGRLFGPTLRWLRRQLFGAKTP